MDSVIEWLNHKSHQGRIAALIALGGLPLLLVGAVSALYRPAAPIAGCAAGVALFVASYGYWHTVLPEERREATDFKARYDYKHRTGLVGAALAVWLIIVLLLGQFLPGPFVGTAFVFVVISLFWIWRATPQEAVELRARWEQAQKAKAAAREQQNESDEG